MLLQPEAHRKRIYEVRVEGPSPSLCISYEQAYASQLNSYTCGAHSQANHKSATAIDTGKRDGYQKEQGAMDPEPDRAGVVCLGGNGRRLDGDRDQLTLRRRAGRGRSATPVDFPPRRAQEMSPAGGPRS